jgi:hypothetical protein
MNQRKEPEKGIEGRNWKGRAKGRVKGRAEGG